MSCQMGAAAEDGDAEEVAEEEVGVSTTTVEAGAGREIRVGVLEVVEAV